MAFDVGGYRFSNKVLVIAGIIFGVVMVTTLVVSFLLAQKAKTEITNRQTLTNTGVGPDTGRQVKRIEFKRATANGDEYLEILWDGTVNTYDNDHKLIRTGKQGFARIDSLFSNIDKHWAEMTDIGGGGCVSLTIETNVGTTVINCHSGGGSGGVGNDLIKEIVDVTDDTFAPTPTFAPTNTPAVGRPEPTWTPYPTYGPPPPTITGGGTGPTPTPLPGYMTAPPFKCSDYHSSKPFIISNIICGLDQ
jgi:hypothetical protein